MRTWYPQVGIDFKKVRRLGVGADYEALQAEQRKQDKIAEQEAAKNAEVRAVGR